MVLTAILFLSGSAAAYSGIQAVMGEEVTISGYASSGPYVYLFLTGPNLPENGIALHDITKRADQGYFTKVSVDGDDRWSYTWHTGSINGKLDEGTYTIWVVSGPNDRSRLAQADYRTISVTIGKPSITVDTPVQPGTMDLQSVPGGASVTVSGDPRGTTPLVISGLSPGTYTVTFTRSGYVDMSTQVIVQAGSTSEVIATLQPKTGALAVNSSPPGARVLLDGAYAGLSPVLLENISADNHTVGVEIDGYTAASRTVSIAAGQVNPVEVSLVPVPAPVTPATTRAAGPGPAIAGALCLIILGAAWSRRNW
ncbi:MAG: PEGA domain-containing protein [Methanoregula sp.]